MTIKVWSWRQAIAKAKIEPSTKLVLYTLGNYMNEHGTGCYPTQEQIAEESGLSLRSVSEHLRKAAEAGFIEVTKHGFGGQNWANNEYRARYPEHIEPGNPGGKEATGVAEIAHAAIASPSGEGSATNDKKVTQPLRTNTPLQHSREEEEDARARDADPPPLSPDEEVGKDLLEAFQSASTAVYGETAGNWHPNASDRASAKTFTELGAKADWFRQLVVERMKWTILKAKPKITGLAYFRDIVPEALQKVKAAPKPVPPAMAADPRWIAANRKLARSYQSGCSRQVAEARRELKELEAIIAGERKVA